MSSVVVSSSSNRISDLNGLDNRPCKGARARLMIGMIACALCAMVVSGKVAYADVKIATIDVNRLLNESKEAKENRVRLDDLASKARKKVEEQRAALLDKEKKLKEKKVAANAPEVEALKDEARKFEHSVRDTDEDLKKEFLKANKNLTERALRVISSYAQKNKIDYVLDKGEKSRGPVLFADPGVDITTEILKDLNG